MSLIEALKEDQGVVEADDTNRFERKLDPTATGIARNAAEVKRVAESVARREAGEGGENEPHRTPSTPRIDRPRKRGRSRSTDVVFPMVVPGHTPAGSTHIRRE